MKNNYNTEQRKNILEYLSSHNDTYVKVEDIFKFMKEKQCNIGLTTIYRFLKILEEQGNLRIETIENTKHFQYIIEECKSHYHLKCKKCNRIIHLYCNEFKKIDRHVQEQHKFHISEKETIYGICDECYKK